MIRKMPFIALTCFEHLFSCRKNFVLDRGTHLEGQIEAGEGKSCNTNKKVVTGQKGTGGEQDHKNEIPPPIDHSDEFLGNNGNNVRSKLDRGAQEVHTPNEDTATTTLAYENPNFQDKRTNFTAANEKNRIERKNFSLTRVKRSMIIKSFQHIPPPHNDATLPLTNSRSTTKPLSSHMKLRAPREENLFELHTVAEKFLFRAMRMHYDKNMPRQALELYQKSFESGEKTHDFTIRARITLNYAKCLEDHVEYRTLVRTEQTCERGENESNEGFPDPNRSSFTLSPIVDPGIRMDKMELTIHKACKLYRYTLRLLFLSSEMNYSLRIHLRLAECYEKARRRDKARECVRRCEKLLGSAANRQFDVGLNQTIPWYIELYAVHEIYLCESREKSIIALKRLTEKQIGGPELFWYSHLFLARRCALHSKKFYRLAELSYEMALHARPDSFLVSLEFAQFLQFAKQKPLEAVLQYTHSVQQMRRNMDWPGVREVVLPEALFNLAYAHLITVEPDLAYPLLEEAFSLYTLGGANRTNTLRVQLFLARALEDCRNHTRAAIVYENIVTEANHSADGLLHDQIDLIGRRTSLSAAEIYFRFALFQRTRGHLKIAEAYFVKALATPSIDLSTKVETIDAYAQFLRTTDQHTKACKLEDRLFDLARCHYQKEVKLPLKSWMRRLDFLEEFQRHEESAKIFDFLLSAPLKNSLDPQDRQELMRRHAEHLQTQGKYKEACEEYRTCLRFNPLNIHMLVQYAWSLSRWNPDTAIVQAAFDEAIQGFERQPFSRHWDGCFIYGEYAVYLHDVLHHLDRAEVFYLKAVHSASASESENYAQVCGNLAILYYRQGKAQESSQWFSTAISTPIPHYGAWQLFLDTLIQSHSVSKGVATAQQMLKLFHQEKSEICLRLAKLYEMKDPSDAESILSTYFLSMKYGCKSDAEGLTLEEICTQTSSIHAAAEFAAVLNHRLHRHNDAATCYNILRHRMPNDTNITLHYGRMLYDHGIDHEGAREQFNTVLYTDPGNLFALDFLADYYQTQKEDIDTAEDCHLQALRLSRGNGAPRATYQYTCFAMQNTEVTTLMGPHYARIYEKNPTDASALSCYATYMHLLLGPEDLHVAKLMYIQETVVEEEEEVDEGDPKINEPTLPSEKDIHDRVAKVIAAVKKAMRRSKKKKRKN